MTAAKALASTRYLRGPSCRHGRRRSGRRPRTYDLVLQRKRADCGIASPVIAALCGQNANRQSEQERGDDSDYALSHHGSPLGFRGDLACIAAYSTAACDGRHRFGESSCTRLSERVFSQESITLKRNPSRKNHSGSKPWFRGTWGRSRLPSRCEGAAIPRLQNPCERAQRAQGTAVRQA